MVLETALSVDDSVPKIEKRFTGTRQMRRCQLHMAHFHTKTEKYNAPKSTEQYQSRGIITWREHSMRVGHDYLR